MVTIIASIIIAWRAEKIKDINLFFIVVGMLANYVDFLTVPLITIGVPLGIWILYKSKNEKYEKAWLDVIMTSISWTVGYGSAWIMKWSQFDLTIAEGNLLYTGIMQILYRSSNKNLAKFFFYSVGEDTPGHMEGHLDTTFSYYKNIICSLLYCLSKAGIGTIITAVIISFIGKMKKIAKSIDHVVYAFLLILLMPIVWYVVFSNHTLLHDYYAYRHCVVFMIGALLAFYHCFLENE
jgi:hypothetical protein